MSPKSLVVPWLDPRKDQTDSGIFDNFLEVLAISGTAAPMISAVAHSTLFFLMPDVGVIANEHVIDDVLSIFLQVSNFSFYTRGANFSDFGKR